MYKNVKFELKLEDYLVTLIDPVRSNLIILRLSNHKMPVELVDILELMEMIGCAIFVSPLTMEMNIIIFVYVLYLNL